MIDATADPATSPARRWIYRTSSVARAVEIGWPLLAALGMAFVVRTSSPFFFTSGAIFGLIMIFSALARSRDYELVIDSTHMSWGWTNRRFERRSIPISTIEGVRFLRRRDARGAVEVELKSIGRVFLPDLITERTDASAAIVEHLRENHPTIAIEVV